MTTYLTVTVDDIRQLSDGQFRELIARLSQAEIVSLGFSTSAVTFGGDQRAPDGGIDVRISLGPNTAISGYVPASQTGFQVKAENFGPADINAEMRPGGILRPSISDLINSKGAYVIASSKSSVADRALKLRKEAMRACVSGFDLSNDLIVDFYDCQRVATWVEKFPSIIAWVRNLSGRGSQGWQGYGAWGHKETDANSEYLLDDVTKIFAPASEQPLTAEAAILRLRADLATAGTCVRLTGLSGVGKTRLAQALFDKRIATENPVLDRNTVLYADSGDSPTPLPIHMVEELRARQDRVLLIIDNCSSDQHARLAEQVSVSDRLSLLTIEYDIREDLPDRTKCYRLEPSSDGLIKRMLRARYSQLSGPDIETISEFSGGNSRIAIALAETAEISGQLSKLNDDALFQRLFRQNNENNDELQQAAQICALLYSFDGDLLEGEAAELPVLATLLGTTPTRLLMHVAELNRRGLIQQRGPWRACLPHALANRLAERALQSLPTSLLSKTFVTDGSERIARSFSRRLGYLTGSLVAQAITKEWLSPSGMLGNLETLTDLGLDMFCNVAPVEVASALATIQRAANNPNFLSSGSKSATLLKVIRGASYDPLLFSDGIEALLALSATGENQSNSNFNENLSALFFIHYSGTLTPPEMRADFVRSALNSMEPKRQEAGLIALRASLKTMNFHYIHSFEFGALRRTYGWHPKDAGDVEKWFSLFLDIAMMFGGTQTELGRKIRAIVGRKFSGLWWRTPVIAKIEEVSGHFASIDGWPDGWQGVQQALRQAPKDGEDDSALARLKKLERRLSPKNLISEVQALVLSGGYMAIDLLLDDDDDGTDHVGRHSKWERKIRSLGTRVAKDENALASLASDLVRRHDKNSWSFGMGVGETIDDPIAYLEQLRVEFSKTDRNEQSLQFIVAFIHGAQTKYFDSLSQYMEGCLYDEVWAEYFPRLQSAIPLNSAAVQRLLTCARIGKAPSYAFDALAGGRVTDTLSSSQVNQLIIAIAAMHEGGRWAASILTMVIHLAGDKSEQYRAEIRACARTYLSSRQWLTSDEEEYRIGEIANFAFMNGETPEEAGALALAIREQLGGYYFYKVRNVLSVLFRTSATAVLDAIYTPDADGDYDTAGSMLSASSWNVESAPINAAPSREVIDWCSADAVERLGFIAQHCSLFDQLEEEQAKGWSELALAIMDHSPDRSSIFDVLKEHIEPKSWSGSRSKILRSRILLLDVLSNRYPDLPCEKISEARQLLEESAAWSEKQEVLMYRSSDETFE